MTSELALITPVKALALSNYKSHTYYAKDDSCIPTSSSYYAKTLELEEFSSLFKKPHKPSQPLAINVSLELEVLRNSLGKILKQRRMGRRYSHDSTFPTDLQRSAMSNTSEEEDSCFFTSKVHNLLWDLENCLVKIQDEEGGLPANSSIEIQPHMSEGSTNHVPGTVSTVPISKASVSNATMSTFSNRGLLRSDALNDKSSDISDDSAPSLSFSLKPINSKYSVTVSEVYIIAILAGWVLKLSNTSFFSLKSWKRRFLVLTPTTLFRYKSSTPVAVADEYLELTPDTIACVTDKFAGKRWVLEITTPSKSSWYIQTESLDELKTWLNALKASVIRAKYCNNRLPSSDSFSISLAKQDNVSFSPITENSRRNSSFTIPLTRPKTLNILNANSKSMSALPPQLPIPKYLPPLPPITDGATGVQRQRIFRAPSSPAILGSSIAKVSRVTSLNRRMQTNHIDTSLPSSRRNSAVLPTLNEDDDVL